MAEIITLWAALPFWTGDNEIFFAMQKKSSSRAKAKAGKGRASWSCRKPRPPYQCWPTGPGFPSNRTENKTNRLPGKKVVFPSPWALSGHSSGSLTCAAAPGLHRCVLLGPGSDAEGTSAFCCTSWSLDRQKQAAHAGKPQQTPGKCTELYKAVWKETQQSSLQPSADCPKSLGFSKAGTAPYLSPPREGCFSVLKPPGALKSAAALQSLQSIQLPIENAQRGNIKITPQNYVSKIIIGYTVTLASKDGEASFCRELQTESITGVLPCRSKLAPEMTGQQDGSSSCLFPSWVHPSTSSTRAPLLIKQSFS